jgi:hypothetical protein
VELAAWFAKRSVIACDDACILGRRRSGVLGGCAARVTMGAVERIISSYAASRTESLRIPTVG